MTRRRNAKMVRVMPCIIGALLITVPAIRAGAAEPLALTIDNMHEKSLVHSGFVAGTASDASGAVKVQVSLDGGAFLDASGLASWKFQLPSGTATWRDNSAHTVAARTLNADGEIVASSAALSVRKGNNRDVDGDGFEEHVRLLSR